MDDSDSLQKGRTAKHDRPRSITGMAAAGFPESVSGLIAAQAGRTPRRTAIAWNGGEAWTYARLMQTADAVARDLVARGVARGDLVGICVPRRPEMVAAVLGVMRAGAAYVALDPKFPASRLRYMAEHAGIRNVLVWRESEAPAGFPAACRPFALEGFDPEGAPDIALPGISGNDLAYVLYTSGSTGQPKGVRILQRNLVNFLTSMRREPGIAADDVLCAVTTLSFDIAALELYLPLMVGARVALATEEEQADFTTFSRLLQKHAVTILQTTPTRLRLLLDSNRLHEVRGMKLLVGGETMPRDLAETFLPVSDELWNMYGPTETTVWSTIHPVVHGTGPVPLGTPIAGTSIHLLNDARQPVADGDIGEIWIGGAGVADGYLHDPEKTAERFVSDPFATDGSQMYRTGDLGSLRDGALHFHGRADDQIKLNGFRIEPGDIEAAALAEAGIRQAVAVMRDVGGDDKRLILYVAADPDPGLVARLRASLRERLPDYMRPRFVQVLDALPHTPNGKIDRMALPLPDAITTAVSAPSDPADGLEPAIAGIWSELLKIRNIGPDEDFFDLGGDSLLAVRVFERMQALTGINLPLSVLLTEPTIARQVAIFRAAGAREPGATATPTIARGFPDKWSPLVAIQPRGKRPPLFLIHAIGGNVLNYVPLGRGLGAEQPVYGIQAIGLDGLTPPIASIPTMAACYVSEIQRVQPHGPYFLAGGSMGGLIAYEIAQQLREQGESIGLLAMMDTRGPGYRRGAAEVIFAASARVILFPLGALRRMLDRLRVRRARAAGLPLPHALRHREIERAHHRALAAYRPKPYDGRVLLFKVSERRRFIRNAEALGWERCVHGGIEAVGLPGNHNNLIEQPELLRGLREALEKTQSLAAGRC